MVYEPGVDAIVTIVFAIPLGWLEAWSIGSVFWQRQFRQIRFKKPRKESVVTRCLDDRGLLDKILQCLRSLSALSNHSLLTLLPEYLS